MKKSFQLVFIILLGLTPLIANTTLQNGMIQVGVTIGEVYAIDAEAHPVKVISGEYYDQGSSFSTKADSTIELIFSNGSTLLLNPDTTIIVRTFKQVPIDLPAQGKYLEVDREPSPSITEIILEKGKVTGEVRKLNSQSSYSIRTGVGIVKIKGTVYTVGYTESLTKGAGNIDASCVKGMVVLTLFGSSTGPVPVEAGKRIIAQGPTFHENGMSHGGQAVKTIADAGETKSIPANVAQGSSEGVTAEGGDISVGAKIASTNSNTQTTLSDAAINPRDDDSSFNSPVVVSEIIPVTISASNLDEKQISDITKVLSTGSSLPIKEIYVVQEKATQTPPQKTPEAALTSPVNSDDKVNNINNEKAVQVSAQANPVTINNEKAVQVPAQANPVTTPTSSVKSDDTSIKSNKFKTKNPQVKQIINRVINDTDTVIERGKQTNSSPVE